MSNATKHGAIVVVAFLATSVLNYAFSLALGWLLPPEQFGQVGVAQSLLLLLALVVGSGFAWTAAHDVAASGVTDQIRRRFRAAWIANTALGLLLAGGLWAAYTTGWLPLGPAYRVVVPMVGLTTILLAARSVVNGVARGLYRFEAVALNLAGEVAVKAGLGLALVAVGARVEGVMTGFALGAAAALAHSLWIVRPARLWHGRGWFDAQVVATTAPLFVGVLGPALMLNLDVLGLKLLAPAGQGDALAGLYQAAVILARTPVFIAQSLTLVLFSYVAGMGRGAEEQGCGVPLHPGISAPLLPYARTAVWMWAMWLLPAGLALVLAPQAALALFFPAHYQAAGPALRIASGGGVLLALVILLNGVFQAAGDRRRPAIAAGLAVIIQVVVLVWLIPVWGTLGAALSLLAAGLISLVSLTPAFAPLLHSAVGAKDFSPLLRASAPLLILAIPLMLLPDGGRGAAALKLGMAGLAYLIALAGQRFPHLLRHRPGEWRPLRPGSGQVSESQIRNAMPAGQGQSKLFVVIPTYNEADNLPALVAELFAQPVANLQIVIVDDNSPDGTGHIAEELSRRYAGRLHVIHRPGKQGLGSAYRDGFRYALAQGADFIVQMDADFSHSPAYIPQFLRHANGYDVIVGSRYVAGGRTDPRWQWGRYALSWWANVIYVRLILGLQVRDATAGFKCWSRPALETILAYGVHSNGYIFQVEMAYLAEKLGLRVLELSIYFEERRAGRSKMSIGVKIEAVWRTWYLRWHYRHIHIVDRADRFGQHVGLSVQS